MSASAVETTGFVDPGTGNQRVFRTVLNAMARPGRILPMEVAVNPPAPLLATAAGFLLAMADFETTIWLDAPLAAAPEVGAYLRFQTGARIVADSSEATFAVVSDPALAPPLTAFAQGSAEYPDRSATLIVQCRELKATGLSFEGPGIEHRVSLSVEPALPGLAAQLAANRASFPCGVDLVFVAPLAIVALPRSVRVVKG